MRWASKGEGGLDGGQDSQWERIEDTKHGSP